MPGEWEHKKLNLATDTRLEGKPFRTSVANMIERVVAQGRRCSLGHVPECPIAAFELSRKERVEDRIKNIANARPSWQRAACRDEMPIALGQSALPLVAAVGFSST